MSPSQSDMWKWQPLPVRCVNGFGMNVASMSPSSRPSAPRAVHHVAEEDRAVAARERVGVGEVLLELAVRVLVVVRVVAPAELVDVARDRRQEVVVAREALEVVAGLLERVERVGEPDRAVVRRSTRKYSSSRPILNSKPLLARRGELAAEDRARVVRPLLAVDGDVAGEAGERRLPGHRREAREVGDRGDVGIARHLADLAGGEAGEAGAVGDEVVEIRRRARASRSAARTCRRTARRRTRSRAPPLPADVLDGGRGGVCGPCAPPSGTSRDDNRRAARARRWRLLYSRAGRGVSTCAGRAPPRAARSSPRSRP